jgi:hypothetical protein
MALITVIIIIIVMLLMTINVTALITPDARALGAGGSCVDKSDKTRVPRSIWPAPGRTTEQTRAGPLLGPSWCGPIMLERL